MPLTDPYSTIAVPRDLIAEFLGVFARCEFAMNMTAYVRDREIAAAAWQRLANDAGGWLQVPRGTELEQAIEALTSEPPRPQAFVSGWRAVPLPGAHRVTQAGQGADVLTYPSSRLKAPTPRIGAQVHNKYLSEENPCTLSSQRPSAA